MNVPKIRYDNFTKEWEKVKLSSQASFLQGLTYTPNDVSNDGTIVLRSSNIQNSMVDYNDIVRVNIIIPEKLKIKENDILMCVRNGSKSLVGKTAWLSKNEEKCTWGAFMNIIRPKERNKFVYYYLNSKYFYNHVWKDLGTATVNQITKQTLESCYLNIPSIEEQKKISNTLSLLDQKIKLQSKKIEDLKLFKKGLLQKQYNYIKDKNLVELSYIANIYQPQTISQNKLDNGKYFVFGANGIIGKYSRYNHKQKQITISCRGENSGKVNITPEKCWITGNSMVLNTDNNYNVDKIYLKCVLDSQNLRYLISGSGQPQITRNVILKHKIPLLPILEQKKFRNPFIKLDLKIHLEETKVNKLLDIKKGLMQDMFV